MAKQFGLGKSIWRRRTTICCLRPIRAVSFADIHQRLLAKQYGPPSVIVNGNENGQNAEHALAESKRILLVQLVRELLFNVVKYAGVKEATVNAYAEDSQLCIEVKDQGKGFDTKLFEEISAQEGHFGLFSVHERLALFGGAWTWSPNGGRHLYDDRCPAF